MTIMQCTTDRSAGSGIVLTHAVAVVIVGQCLVLGPLGWNPEANTCSSCYPQSVGLVGLQLSERELGLIPAHVH